MAKRKDTATAAETDATPATGGAAMGQQDGGAATDVDLGAAAAGAVDQVQSSAGQLVDQVKQLATSRLDQTQERLAAGIELAADLLRAAGKQVREQEHPTAAQYIEGAADRVQGFSGSLRDQDVSQVVPKVEGVARQRPGLFLGGGLAVGFLATRFLQSSAKRQEEIERQAAERQEAKRRREAEREEANRQREAEQRASMEQSSADRSGAADRPTDLPGGLPAPADAGLPGAAFSPEYPTPAGDAAIGYDAVDLPLAADETGLGSADFPLAPDEAVLDVAEMEWDLGVPPASSPDADSGRRG